MRVLNLCEGVAKTDGFRSSLKRFAHSSAEQRCLTTWVRAEEAPLSPFCQETEPACWDPLDHEHQAKDFRDALDEQILSEVFGLHFLF